MARGRKRGYSAAIPKHIDQASLPKNIYWADGRWYILEPHPEGGRPRKRTIAYASARLSELHAIAEVARGGTNPGSLIHIFRAFRNSSEYKTLSKTTREDYVRHGEMACAYVLKDGAKLGELSVDRMSVPVIQRLVETIAMGREATPRQPALTPRPSTANHILRFLRRLFAWGIRFGHCTKNPAQGVRQAKEVGNFSMPEPEAFEAVLAFVKARAALPLHSKGAVPPYMPAVMLLAYNSRLRGIEVTDLTDADKLDQGVRSARRKGSLDTITAWNDDLRWAWTWLEAYREKRVAAHRRPVSLKAGERRLLVTQTGVPLSTSALKSSWQRVILAAIDSGVIPAEARFNLHGLKHRGITDTQGTRAHKQDAGGHVTPQMTVRYDHELPVVEPPRLPRKPQT